MNPQQPHEGRRASYHSSLWYRLNSTDRLKLMKFGFSGLLYCLWILPGCKTQVSSGGNRARTWGKGSELCQAGHEEKCQGGWPWGWSHTWTGLLERSVVGALCLWVPSACQRHGDVWAMPSATRFSLRSALKGPDDPRVPLPVTSDSHHIPSTPPAPFIHPPSAPLRQRRLLGRPGPAR